MQPCFLFFGCAAVKIMYKNISWQNDRQLEPFNDQAQVATELKLHLVKQRNWSKLQVPQ